MSDSLPRSERDRDIAQLRELARDFHRAIKAAANNDAALASILDEIDELESRLEPADGQSLADELR